MWRSYRDEIHFQKSQVYITVHGRRHFVSDHDWESMALDEPRRHIFKNSEVFGSRQSTESYFLTYPRLKVGTFDGSGFSWSSERSQGSASTVAQRGGPGEWGCLPLEGTELTALYPPFRMRSGSQGAWFTRKKPLVFIIVTYPRFIISANLMAKQYHEENAIFFRGKFFHCFYAATSNRHLVHEMDCYRLHELPRSWKQFFAVFGFRASWYHFPFLAQSLVDGSVIWWITALFYSASWYSLGLRISRGMNLRTEMTTLLPYPGLSKRMRRVGASDLGKCVSKLIHGQLNASHRQRD